MNAPIDNFNATQMAINSQRHNPQFDSACSEQIALNLAKIADIMIRIENKVCK